MEVRPGYKQTETGVIPKDWEAIKLGNLSKFVSSGKSKKRTACGEYHFYGSTGIIGYCNTPEYDGERILIARVGANAGSLYTVDGRYSVSDNTLVIGLKDSNLTGYIANYLLKENLNRIVFGSGQPLVTGNQLKQVLIAMPTHREEIDSIVEAISNAGNLITSLEKLIEKKKLIKQGVMQELLTGKRRLPGFSGEWQTKRLGDVSNVIMGQSPDSKYYNTESKGLPLIQGNADIQNGKSVSRIWTLSITKECQKGDILITVRAPVGSVGISSGRSCLGRGVCAIQPRSIHGKFLYWQLKFSEDKWNESQQGSTFTSVNSNQIKDFSILCPTRLDEQVAIADVVEDIEIDINMLDKKLQKQVLLKQAMMQELLTGRIRLI